MPVPIFQAPFLYLLHRLFFDPADLAVKPPYLPPGGSRLQDDDLLGFPNRIINIGLVDRLESSLGGILHDDAMVPYLLVVKSQAICSQHDEEADEEYGNEHAESARSHRARYEKYSGGDR